MNSRGIIISVDALLAILIVLSLLGLATFYFGQIGFEAQNSLYLKKVGMDVLSVMEKNEVLEDIIENDTIVLAKPFLEALPHNICGEIKIYEYNDTETVKLSTVKKDCKKSKQEIASIKRSFVRKLGSSANVQVYLAEVNTWQREAK